MNPLFDFKVDKTTSTIYVTREFAADIDLVWDAFTKPEILAQWMGAKMFRIHTKEMNFSVGGRWLYAMVTKENVYVGWSLVEFLEIYPKTKFITRNSFSDENGNPTNPGFTFSITTNSFTAGNGTTTVHIVKKMASLDELEKFVAVGYKEGTAAAMNVLDEYFSDAMANKK